MKKLLLVAAVVALGWYGNQYYQDSQAVQPDRLLEADSSNFICDGREHCSQMTSCAEAIFFIRNCPNTKMDGDHDGVPCESQWCG